MKENPHRTTTHIEIPENIKLLNLSVQLESLTDILVIAIIVGVSSFIHFEKLLDAFIHNMI